MDLPPGFRFHPTDEELITHYLTKKAMDETFSTNLMAEVDLNKCEPWDLPRRDQMGEKELYLLCKKDRKYPTGMRANRATGAGYWKATGKDKEVYRGKTLVGMKKTLVFYKGRAPKGEKTNWVMHEYRLEQGSSSSSSSSYSSYNNFARHPKSEWVLCRVFNKSSGGKKASTFAGEMGSSSPLSPLMDVTCFSTAMEEEFFTSFDGSHGGNLEEFMEMEMKYSRNGIGRQIDGHEGPIQLTWAYAT